MGQWRAHVEEEFEAMHAAGPPGHKCTEEHGHTWKAVAEFSYVGLDDYGWGPDFGLVKSFMKVLDHRNLMDLFVNGNPRGIEVNGHLITDELIPSAENISQWLYRRINLEVVTRGGIMHFVRVYEGGGNMVEYTE